MEEQILRQIELGEVNSDLTKTIENYLKPVLEQNNRNKLPESTAKKTCHFILHLLRSCRQVFDSNLQNDDLAQIVVLGCQGLQSLGYGCYDDHTAMGKVMCFLLVSVIKKPLFLTVAIEIGQYLLEFLVQMDEMGRLSDLESDSPVAKNSFSYLWNTLIARQKDGGGRAENDYKLLSLALRFHSLVNEARSVFDKFYSVIQRDLHSSDIGLENAAMIVDMASDLLKLLARKFEFGHSICTRDALCNIASLSLCFLLNSRNAEKFQQIWCAVEKYKSVCICLKLFCGWKSISLDLSVLAEVEKISERDLLCVTETLRAILDRNPDNGELEAAFLMVARREFNSLNCSKENDDKFRAVMIASKLCTVQHRRLARLLGEKIPKHFAKYKIEIQESKALLQDAMSLSSKTFPPKKMQELSYNVIRFAQGLKESNMTEAISFYKLGVEIIEIWAEKASRPKEGLWSFYYELSSMYFSKSMYVEILDLLENVILDNKKNLLDIAAMYVKCKKSSEKSMTSDRFLASKLPESNSRYCRVLKSEYDAWTKYKVGQVRQVMTEILEKLLTVQTDPTEHGQLILEKAILLWSAADCEAAETVVNEALAVLEESGGSNSMALARAYIWKYVMVKSNLHGTYKLEQRSDATDYKNDVNDFNDKQENEKSSLKFKESFTLKQEHDIASLLLKSLDIIEELDSDTFTQELLNDVEMLYGLFVLNGSTELSLRAALIFDTDFWLLRQSESYFAVMDLQKSLEALNRCQDQNSSQWRILRAKLLLSMGKIQDGYTILEALNAERAEMSTKLVGKFTSVMMEYHRLPLQFIGVNVSYESENSNPLFLSMFSFQCSQKAFAKESGLEPDKLGTFPEKPETTDVIYANLRNQFLVLSDYLSGLLECSRCHLEVGESRYAKTYLQDAMTLALRYCLPKWTSRILIESSKISLMEGHVAQSEEKLRRSHWILNFGFMEFNQKSEPENVHETDDKPKVDSSDDGDTTEKKAINLMCDLGFDEADDLIQSKCLKTESVMAKQEAQSLVNYADAALLPANHGRRCKLCGSECTLYRDLLLARLSVSILTNQSECFLQGGAADGVKFIDVSLESVLTNYKRLFSNKAFEDLVSEQKLTLAKSDAKFELIKDIIETYRLPSNMQYARYFQILAEAYYLLGVQSLNAYFAKPSPIGQEKLPIKKTLMDQLYNDDENDAFQLEMQKEAKEMKAVNEQPVTKNVRRPRKKGKVETQPECIEIQPDVSITDSNANLSTPDNRVSNVKLVKKGQRNRQPEGADVINSESPEVTNSAMPCTAPNAPRRGGKFNFDCTNGSDLSIKRKVSKSKGGTRKAPVDSTPIALDTPNSAGDVPVVINEELVAPHAPKRGRNPRKNAQRPVKTSVSSPEDVISIFTDNGDSPASVASEDLNQLLSTMTLEESPPGVDVKSTKPKVRSSAKTKTAEPKPLATKPRTTRGRKNAVIEETPKPTRQRKTRNARTEVVENLRHSVDDEIKMEVDDLVGEFKPHERLTDSSFQNPAFRDLKFTTEAEFPEIEVLRGPGKASGSGGRRKVLCELSTNVTKSSSIKTKWKPHDGSDVDSAKSYLEEAFALLRHHPVTSLYRNVCQALGVMTSDDDPWTAAFYFNEASCAAYRHEAILALQKKRVQKRQAKQRNETELIDQKIESGIAFPKDVTHFKTMISVLPAHWTTVMISIVTSPFDSTNHMVITRLRADEIPVIFECPGFVLHGGSLIENFEETICDSRMRNSKCEDRVRWWTAKRMYSTSVEKTVEKLENDVFTHYKSLLLGCYCNADQVAMAKKKAAKLISTYKPKSSSNGAFELLSVILQSLSYLSQSQLHSAVQEIFPDSNEGALSKILLDINEFKQSHPMAGQREPVVLILDKSVSHLPFENMPFLSLNAVVRSLSVYTLYSQFIMERHRHHERLRITGLDMTNISYILDPDFNLPSTREQFADWFSELGWVGVVGERPTREDLEKHLTETDMMLYLGHGSGQRYVDGSRIQKLCCRAAVVLMGCSSGALKANGRMEPSGMIVNYLLARSPFVMGNLWDVTDGDIDRFTKALLEVWLSAEAGTKLHAAIQRARSACRLRYLTGSAPVMYGLPL